MRQNNLISNSNYASKTNSTFQNSSNVFQRIINPNFQSQQPWFPPDLSEESFPKWREIVKHKGQFF